MKGQEVKAKEEKVFGYTPEQYKKFKHYAWRYLVLFSLLYCALYCTRLNLGNASAVMMDGLNWTTSDIGILTSTLFWTYGFGQLVNGRLSEIVGPTKFVFFGVLLSVFANLFISLQSSLWAMAIVWGLNGYFQSMGWTPGLATLTKWWPGSSRGFATGFAHAFSGFGQAAATMAVALAFTLFPDMGWRAAFLVPAVFPLVVLVIYKLFAKSTPSKVGLAEYVEDDPARALAEREMEELKREHGKLYPYKYCLSDARFLVWLFIAFATGLARYGLVTWVPLYFIQEFNVDVTAGLLQSLVLPVGMGVGTLVVPWLTDRFCPDNRLPAVVLSALVGALAVLLFFVCSPDTLAGLLFTEAALFVAGFCIYAVNGTAWAYATDIGGRVFSGTAAGLLNCSAYIGAAVQSLVYGFLLNSGGWNVVFITIGLFLFSITACGALSTRKGK